MRKYILIALLAICGCTMGIGSAFAADAYGQFDIVLNRPMTLSLADLGGDYESIDGAGDFLRTYPIIVPDLRGHVFTDLGKSGRVGIGARGFSAILESIIWPTITAEYDLGPVRFTGSLGGGMYIFMGLYNNVHFESIWLPEITAAYMFNDWFHLGLSATGVFVPENEAVGIIGSIIARFSIGGRD